MVEAALKSIAAFAALIYAITVRPACASELMTDAEIDADIIGGDFAGHYADQRPWQEMYRKDKQLSYTEGGRTLDGYWTLDGGVFCTFYYTELSGGCWRVRRVGSNCFEFYSASLAQGDTLPSTARGRWTARGWRKEKAHTCGAPQIS